MSFPQLPSSHFPRRRLRPNPRSTLGYLVFCLVFVALGVFMILDGDWRGWYVAIVFGLGSLMFAAILLPNCAYLELSPEGLTVCSLYRVHRYTWQDIEGFGVAAIALNSAVGFNFSGTHSTQNVATQIAAGLSGYEAALPDTYGMSAEALAAVLNEYRTYYAPDDGNKRDGI
ncbi:MAG: hypothetical protein AAFX40_03065 [Cyanobacteria bacterium J06639_1]